MASAATSPTVVPAAGAPALWRRVVIDVGREARTAIEGIGAATRFVGMTVTAATDVRTWAPETSQQLRALGVGSMPIAMFLAAFTGIVLALLASYTFTGAVPLYFVGTLVGKTIILELAPVLTGLALAGRIGAAIAAEVATMRVTEQIDALETLAYDPFAYLVVPRVLASTTMLPVIVASAMLVGIASAWVASIALLGLSTPAFVKGLRLFFLPFDVQYGLVKSASFGLVIAMVACARGLGARGGAVGVGRAATSAVVISAMAILVLDAFWAVVWLLGHEAKP
jgi:phospholipid/cholesterol/gamma-HCH transport system permease protein